MQDLGLSQTIVNWLNQLGVEMGLSKHGIGENDISKLSQKAFQDPCHQTNMIPIIESDLANIYHEAL